MGVYIKGMEMPTSCDKCSYSAWSNFYQIYVCNSVRKNEPVLFDGKQTKSTAVARSARADNCPLVPVPTHGRLGDLDALITTFCEWGTRLERGRKLVITMGEAKQAIVDIIDSASTIIPAEPLKEEKK